jgi:hypothetical protein
MLLSHVVDVLFGLDLVLLHVGDFHLELLLKNLLLLDVDVSLFNVVLQGHQVFVFLSVQELNLSTLGQKQVILISEFLLNLHVRLLLHVLDLKLILDN